MNYEEVLALTQANSKAIDKLTASVAELSANARAEQIRRDEENARRDKELAESKARWDSFMEKYGGHVDNDGRKVENFLIEGLHKQELVVGPLEFDQLYPNVRCLNKKVVAIELDALLVNGTTVGVLEVKSTLHRNDVLKVKDSLIPRFRKFYPEYQKKELAVMVAGELINPDAAELAHELGYIVLKPNNQGLSVDTSGYKAA